MLPPLSHSACCLSQLVALVALVALATHVAGVIFYQRVHMTVSD